MSQIILINTPKFKYHASDFEKGITELGTDNSYPVGLLLVSQAIKEKTKVKVDFQDHNFYHRDMEYILKDIELKKPEYIGMNATFPTINLIQEISKLTKEKSPNTKIIVGGPAATLSAETILEEKSIDYIVMGEGEETTIELLNNLEKQKSTKNIKGIAYQENSKVIKNQKRNPLKADQIPYLDIENIPNEIKKNAKEITMFTARGCDAYCSFCSTPVIWGVGKKNVRNFDNDRIFSELELYQQKGFDFDKVHFIDDNFTNDWNRVEDFMQKWNQSYGKEGKTWRCLARVRNVNDYDKLQAMANSGCDQLSVGVESVVPEVLKKIGKQVSVEEVNQFLMYTQNLPIKTKGFFMIGFPYETEQNIKTTIDYAANSAFDEIAVNIVMAYPGTRLYHQVYTQGKQITPSFTNKAIENAQTTAEMKLMKYSSIPIDSLCKNVSIEQLYEYKKQAYEQFYEKK